MHHAEVEVDDAVAASSTWDGVGVEPCLVVKVPMPFVRGADASDGVGAALIDFVQDKIEVDDAVAASGTGDSVCVEARQVVKVPMPFVCSANASDGVGASVVSDPVQPHRRQPTRPPHPHP